MSSISETCDNVLVHILSLCNDPVVRILCKRFKRLADENLIYEIDINETKPIEFVIPKCFRLSIDWFKSQIFRFYNANETTTMMNTDQKRFIKKIKRLENVRYLNLTSTAIEDASMLGNVYELDLSWCIGINDASMLKNVNCLDLSHTNVKDVSMLGGVYYLDLSGTPVKDVSMLGGVQILNLSHTKVEDVSMLGNVYDLNLEGCGKVKNMSMLGKVRILDLSGTNVEDVSMLGGVHSLNISHTLVSDVSNLGEVDILNISRLPVSDISMLVNVKVLYISNPSLDSSMLVHTRVKLCY